MNGANNTETVMKSERPKEPIVKKKRLLYRVNRLMANLLNFFFQAPLPYKALTPEESLSILLATGKSYIRLGNGESEILVGLDMATQEYDRQLKNDILRIIREYSPSSRYLMGMTNWRLTRSVAELKATPNQSAFRIWRFMRYIFFRYRMDRITMPFLEADMFRSVGASLPLEKMELLWTPAGHIIILHNNEKYAAWFRERYPQKQIYFLKIPDKNFYFNLEKYQHEILRIIVENSISNDDLVILPAAGPGAKVLCYNLCQEAYGLRCYDMGNFFYMHCREEQSGA